MAQWLKQDSKTGAFPHDFVPVLCPKKMAIVTLTEALLQRLTASDRRIYRDKVLSGFCLRANSRSRVFLVATSVQGKQCRITLGRWPLISVEQARTLAMEALRECRAGRNPAKPRRSSLPTLIEVLPNYCSDKRLKKDSRIRYDSMIRTHFASWKDQPVSSLTGAAFTEHCHEFAQNNGAAIVELGRGLLGAMIRYVNAVYSLQLDNPFHKLASAGLMPERSKPRPRMLREEELPQWRKAVDLCGEMQRDYLLLLLFTGLRRGEAIAMIRHYINLEEGSIFIPDTKNGKPHSLPITPVVMDVLRRRCRGLEPSDQLFKGMSKEHVHNIAIRRGAPRFMLHDLRKLVATTGEKLQISSAVLRRILNHTPPKSDVLHSHYVQLANPDIKPALEAIQQELCRLMAY